MLAVLAAYALAGCTEELLIEEPSYLPLDEGDIIKTKLAVSVNGFAITSAVTKADTDPDNEVPTGETEIMSDFEKQVDNIWVFQYDTDGDILINPRYYTAEYSHSDGSWDVELKPDVESTIYVVANVNVDSWETESTYGHFDTIGHLLAEPLPEPVSITDLSETAYDGHIPMQGRVDGVTPVEDDIIVVPVEHMYAKVKMRFVIDEDLAKYDEVKVTNVSYTNIPWYCQVETLYDGTKASKDAAYPEDYWNSRFLSSANNTADPNNEGLENIYDYVIYVPENIQGETDNTDKDKKASDDGTPVHASSITAYFSYTDENGAQRAASYTVCPGGNDYNNYNIRRNQVYRVTMNIAYPEEIVRQPSANCLFGFAGETISFYPYYRVETGGGYDFENYLYPTPGDGSGYNGQKIAGLKIIWQTEGCIGDNTNGDLVYLVSTAAEGTHDGYEQIYVKTANEGNALIAAYADEECEGDIIWSWHIWVRDPKYKDPTDLANAMRYYTYDWDNTGIYSYKYYTDLGQTPVRIPGYQIMSCNIGALQDEPNFDFEGGYWGIHTTQAAGKTDTYQYMKEGDGIVRTYGMMYQWGRKDPFPPLTTCKGAVGSTNGNGYNTGYYVHEYNDDHTQKLYGNDGKTEVHKTSYDENGPTYSNTTGKGDPAPEKCDSYLFHSHIAASDEGMAYSIKNPTVFLCGVDVIAKCMSDCTSSSSNNTDYVKSLSNYVYRGGWSYDNEYDNNEWGGTDPTESGNTFKLGFQDEEGIDIIMYDDYGTDKSIFDPCPYGWRVSSGDLWLGFTMNGVNVLYDYTLQNVRTDNDDGTWTNKSPDDSEEYGLLDYINYDPDTSCHLGLNLYLGQSWRSGQTSWFPTQGFLLPDGSGYRVGGCGNYVNANADADPASTYDRVYVTHIHDSIQNFRVFEHQLHYVMKSAANPLRCVRDTM